VKQEITWQLGCDLAGASDSTQESLDSETDSVVCKLCSGPKVHDSTFPLYRDNNCCMATIWYETKIFI